MVLFPGTEQGTHEKKLLNMLLDMYNVLERPVANESEPLEVKFGLTLQQIIDVVSWCVSVLRMSIPVIRFAFILLVQSSQRRWISDEKLSINIPQERLYTLSAI